MADSGSPWRNRARPIIARVIAEHGHDERALRKALHAAYPFGPRENHPYKIWLDEIKRQLSGNTVDPHKLHPVKPCEGQGNLFE